MSFVGSSQRSFNDLVSHHCRTLRTLRDFVVVVVVVWANDGERDKDDLSSLHPAD